MNSVNFSIVGLAFCGANELAEILGIKAGERGVDQDFLRRGARFGERYLCKSDISRIQKQSCSQKIILMLNPPIIWMRAWHHEMLRLGYETQVDFGQALAVEECRFKGERLPPRCPEPNWLQYRRGACFSSLVNALFEEFGHENVFVGLREDLENQTKSFWLDLSRFLEREVSPPSQISWQGADEHLQGTHHFDLAMQRGFSKIPGGQRLQKTLRRSLGTWYRKTADKIFAPMSDHKINPILEEELLEEFEPEITRLSELLGRDLSHWHQARFPRDREAHHHH